MTIIGTGRALAAATALTAFAAACTTDDDQAADETATAEAAAETATTAAERETTTTEPETTTTTAPPEPILYEGSGDQVIDIELPDRDTAALGTVSHTGERNFAMWELDESLGQIDLAVNTIGGYEGVVLLNGEPGAVTRSLEVTADGAWSIEVSPIDTTARRFGDSIEGQGDDVVIYEGEPGVVALRHDGGENFAIWAHDASGGGSDLLVNEIGSFEGTVPLRSELAVLEVTADGAWSIAPGS